MLLEILKKLLSNSRLTTQILTLQIMTIGLIFAMLTVICFYLINGFQQYIQAELLEAVIQKSIISNIQSLVLESMKLTFMTYSQFGNEVALLKRLFIYQRDNKIMINGLLEDCEHAEKIHSYQQCFNGSIMNNPELIEMQQFISFQNSIIPYRQDHQQFPGYLNMYLGKEFSYSVQVQEQKPIYDKTLENIYFQFVNYNLQVALTQIQNADQQEVCLFVTIPQSKIAIGILSKEYLQPFQNLEYEGIQVRTYIVIESGLILTDSKLEFQGQYFQNISGFTNNQFELIKNYTLGKPVQNQCEQKVQGKTLCLMDTQNKQKFIFSYSYKTEYVQFIINILDANFVGQIRQDFNEQFNDFVDLQIRTISIGLAAILVLCLGIQALLIINLSRPLYKLVQIAQYNFNHNQYRFETLIKKNNRSQIQKLQDSYFDVINLTKKQNYEHIKQYYKPSIENIGQIVKKEYRREAVTLRALIMKFIK